jgi:glutathione S-transferase
LVSVKLFYARGSCSLSPHIVLCELGLSFTLERVDLATKRTASGENYLVVNPKGYVPALQLDDGEVLTEGPAITQYLADVHAPGILVPPPGTVDRARANAWLHFIGTELHKPFGPLFDPRVSPDARAAATGSLNRGFLIVERALADGRPFLAGESFALPDIYLFVVQAWASITGFNLSAFPRMIDLSGRVATRPSVREALATERQGEKRT